jgi:hypothetical protein
MRHDLKRRVAVVIATLAATACNAGSNEARVEAQEPEAGAVAADAATECQGGAHPFFELARQASGQSPIQLSAAEAVERTGIVALGHLIGVTQGHTVDYREGASSPADTIVMSFEIDETLKGPPNEVEYVEYVSGAFAAEQFSVLLPVEMPMMLFLRTETAWSETTYMIENEGLGVPDGQVLRSFFPLIQIVTACGKGLEYPLGDETGGQLFTASNLAQLRDEVVSLLP